MSFDLLSEKTSRLPSHGYRSETKCEANAYLASRLIPVDDRLILDRPLLKHAHASSSQPSPKFRHYFLYSALLETPLCQGRFSAVWPSCPSDDLTKCKITLVVSLRYDLLMTCSKKKCETSISYLLLKNTRKECVNQLQLLWDWSAFDADQSHKNPTLGAVESFWDSSKS